MNTSADSSQSKTGKSGTRYWLTFLVLSLSLIGAATYMFVHRPSPVVLRVIPPRLNPTATRSISGYYRFHILGAVNSPGVYSLPAGATLQDAVHAAGGFSALADPDKLNLAAEIHDQDQIVVPDQTRLDTKETNIATGENSVTVDINTADSNALQTLPGIGPVLAERIIEYRTTNGRFKDIDELLSVKGIGEVKLEQLRSWVTVNP